MTLATLKKFPIKVTQKFQFLNKVIFKEQFPKESNLTDQLPLKVTFKGQFPIESDP